MLNEIFSFWRKNLQKILFIYKEKKEQTEHFFLYLFIFFIIINITCYWFAMVSAFPNLVFGSTFNYYFKVQFPVGILGALFDSLSFFVTIYIVKRALLSNDNKIYIAHLSIDLIIATIATFWVLFVFIVSGWIVSYIETINQPVEVIKYYDHETNINKRTDKYLNTVNDAIKNPSNNIQNIYFGIIMGLTAMIPTIIHFTMFINSIYNILFKRQK